MTPRSHLVIAICGALVVLILGASVLVWPNDQRAHEVRDDVRRLRELSMAASSVTVRLEGLGREMQRLRRRHGEIVRMIPPVADVDHLADTMDRALDGHTVYGPTIRPGAAGPAMPGSRLSEQVLPLLVDMDASLDSIFDLLHGVESMERLVRVTSLRAEADRLEERTGAPMLTATIGLELVFDPPTTGEGL